MFNLSVLPRSTWQCRGGLLAVNAFPVTLSKGKKKKRKTVNVASCVCNAYCLLSPLRLVMSLVTVWNGCWALLERVATLAVKCLTDFFFKVSNTGNR